MSADPSSPEAVFTQLRCPACGPRSARETVTASIPTAEPAGNLQTVLLCKALISITAVLLVCVFGLVVFSLLLVYAGFGDPLGGLSVLALIIFLLFGAIVLSTLGIILPLYYLRSSRMP